MHFTLSTVPIGLLILYLCHRSKGQLLPVAMFVSIFQAASLVNIGPNTGVQPAYLVLLFAVAKSFCTLDSPKLPQAYPARWSTLVLFAFVTYSFLSAFVSPFVFQGTPMTHPGYGVDIPLAWNTGHLNQLFYLLLSFSIFLVLAYRSSPSEVRRSIDWYIGGCVLAALIGFYQFIGMKANLPFPRAIFDTSPTYAIFGVYDIGTFTRVNSTFPEASAVAGALAPALAILLWRISSGGQSKKHVIKAAVILAGILLSMSATGYVCLIFLGGIAGCRFVLHWQRGYGYRAKKALLIVPMALGFVFCLALTRPREYIADLVDTVLLTKTHSDSYKERSMWNQSALETASRTYWLGVGFGYCRASGLLQTTLANIGVPGVGLFTIFLGQLYLPVLSSKVRMHPERQAVMLALAAYLLDGVVAGPELTQPLLWVLMAAAAKASGRFLPIRFPFVAVSDEEMSQPRQLRASHPVLMSTAS